MMVFGGGTFSQCLGHEGGALTNQIRVLIRDPQRDPLPLPPCEDTRRKMPSINQEAGFQQTSNLPAP